MELTFVGTGSGKTSLERFHTSILISKNDRNLLIDAGDGISKALLSANISSNDLDSIIISHTHADHFAGIVSLLTQMKINKRVKLLKIFIHKEIRDFLKKFINVSYLFEETIGFDLHIIGYDFEKTITVTENLKVLPRKNGHVLRNEKLNGYDDLPFVSSSFLIQSESMNLQYTADVGIKSDLLLFSDFQIDNLIAEATHIELNEILEMIDIVRPKQCWLVHIDNEEKLLKELDALLDNKKDQFVLTNDGMKINLSL